MLRTIRRIQITNLRALRSVDLSPSRVNLLVGPTGAGKTTLRVAVELAIARRNIYTDGRGTGIQTQVSHGARSGSVVLTYTGDDDEDVTASVEFPKESGRDAKIALALRYLEMAEATLQCLVRGNFLDLPDADRRQVLCDVLGIDSSPHKLRNHLNEWDGRFPDLEAWLDTEAARIGWDGLDWEKFTREQRTAANRVVKEAQAHVTILHDRCLDADGNETAPPAVPEADMVAARAQRDKHLQDITAIEASEAPDREAYEARLREWTSEKKRREDILLRYTQAREGLERANSSIPVRPDKYRTAADLQTALAKVDAIVAGLASTRSAAVSSRSMANSGPCPHGICLRKQQADIDSQIEGIDRDLDKQRAFQEQYRQLIRRSETFENGLRAAQDRITIAEGYLAEWTAAREAIQEEQAPKPEPPPSRADGIENLRMLVAQVEQRIAELREGQCARETWEREYLQYGEESTRLEQLQDEAARWDACVKAFEPKGLAARLAAQPVAEWVAEVDRGLATFGMRFRLVMGDKEWAFEGQGRSAQDWTPANQLSGGERLLASACVQVALARRTGLTCVFLDEVQMADASLRVQLVRWLLGTGVQAFLFAAAQERDSVGDWVRPRDPGIPGLAVYWVENGQILEMKNGGGTGD